MADGRNGNDSGARRLAIKPLLHLLKLLPGNAHAKRLPAQTNRQKQKRRDGEVAALMKNGLTVAFVFIPIPIPIPVARLGTG